MAHTALEQEIAVIGDITVNADEDYVQIVVDDDVALFMARDKTEGLSDLVGCLYSLMK